MKNEESSLEKDYKDGTIIFEENAVGKEMYTIITGKVKIIKKKDSIETILATLDEGDFFGEMSLFDNYPRSATAKASGDVRLIVLNKKNFLKKISKNPSLAFRILEKMSQRIRITDEKILSHIL